MTDTPDIVQQVARAICWNMDYPSCKDMQCVGSCDAKRVDDDCIRAANAVLTLVHSLLQEPSDEMYCAGDEAIIETLNKLHGSAFPTPAQVCWRAMLAASPLAKAVGR